MGAPPTKKIPEDTFIERPPTTAVEILIFES
jgi:hypothetical protein